MNNWEDTIYIFLAGAMMAFTAVGFSVATIMPDIERWNRRFFMSLFSVIMLLMVAALADLLVWENPGMILAEKIATYFEYLFISLPLPMFTAYLLHSCDGKAGEKWQRNKMFRATLALWGVFLILLGIAQDTTLMYYFTSEGNFYRGAWHPLLLAPLDILLLLNLAGVIRRRSLLPRKYYTAFLIHMLPLTVTFLAHSFFFVPMLVFFGVVISTLSVFGVILYDQIDQYMRQQKEISHQRASIMVLQMRPHFIYNAMMSIYYLCAKDAKKAQQVTLDFTTYLRKNFTAIVSEDTVPFADELAHTRAYLAIEQVQFEDSLCVEYDTPHTEFRLPPLTLQPIVENAVKHGMDPEYAPLEIFIRTRETEVGSEIIVEDSGLGFDLAATKSEPHTALENIRTRLSMMCGGSLTLHPREGGGTVVKVIIP
ncbi:MAG: histidine kinase [Selenomonadaceae bacterium]|nr:histidine kinase [Selenomonadaceae bacterium]